jgi:hypothetical protein
MLCHLTLRDATNTVELSDVCILITLIQIFCYVYFFLSGYSLFTLMFDLTCCFTFFFALGN